MSISKLDHSKEQYLGIRRLYDLIYMYGDEEWTDSLGKKWADHKDHDIAIRLLYGKVAPTIQSRSEPSTELAFFYTQELKDLIESKVEWVELFDHDQKKPYYYNIKTTDSQWEMPAEMIKYIVGKPKFVEKKLSIMQMNVDNAKLQRAILSQTPEEFSGYNPASNNAYFDFYEKKIGENITAYKKTLKRKPVAAAKPVAVAASAVKPAAVAAATAKPVVVAAAAAKPNPPSKTRKLPGRKYNGKFLRGIDQKYGWPYWIDPNDPSKYTWRQPDAIRLLDTGGWVQEINPKNPKLPIWKHTLRGVRKPSMPIEFANALGIAPQKRKSPNATSKANLPVLGTAAATVSPLPAPVPVVATTAPVSKPGFFSRMFGSKTPAPVASPATVVTAPEPVATVAATAVPAPVATVAATAVPAPVASVAGTAVPVVAAPTPLPAVPPPQPAQPVNIQSIELDMHTKNSELARLETDYARAKEAYDTASINYLNYAKSLTKKRAELLKIAKKPTFSPQETDDSIKREIWQAQMGLTEEPTHADVLTKERVLTNVKRDVDRKVHELVTLKQRRDSLMSNSLKRAEKNLQTASSIGWKRWDAAMASRFSRMSPEPISREYRQQIEDAAAQEAVAEPAAAALEAEAAPETVAAPAAAPVRPRPFIPLRPVS